MQSLWLIRQKEGDEIFAFFPRLREEVADIDTSKRTIIRKFKGALNKKEHDLFEYLQIHKPHI